MTADNRIDWGTVKSGLILMGIATLTFIIFIFLTRNPFSIDGANKQLTLQPNINKTKINEIKQTINQDLKQQQFYYEDFSKQKKIDIYPNGLYTPQSLIQYCQNGNTDQNKCDQEIIKLTKTIQVKGKVNDAYLYIKAAVSRGNDPFGPLTKNDSIYFFIDDSQKYGGHLLRSDAVWTRENKDSTELLFHLTNVPFTTIPYPANDEVTPIMKPDILGLINQTPNHYIVSFVSSFGVGRIDRFKISFSSGEIVLN